MRCAQAVDAAAYVLGALVPTELASYERHLAGCAECRQEIVELAVLPGLLSRIDADAAVTTLAPSPASAPPHLLASTLRSAAAERSRSRRRHRLQLAGTGLAAACLAVLLGIGASTVDGYPVRPTPAILAQMTPVSSNVPIAALVGYTPAGSGSDIRMLCFYEDQSPDATARTVNLAVYPRGGGAPQRASPWQVGPGGVGASPFNWHTKFAPGAIARIELVGSDAIPLLRYQPT
jgi:hypothetical protein